MSVPINTNIPESTIENMSSSINTDISESNMVNNSSKLKENSVTLRKVYDWVVYAAAYNSFLPEGNKILGNLENTFQKDVYRKKINLHIDNLNNLLYTRCNDLTESVVYESDTDLNKPNPINTINSIDTTDSDSSELDENN